jgi:hypothetical protein
MQGVLRSLFMTKLKTAVAVLATLGATATGAGVLAFEPGTPGGVASPARAEPGLETQEGRERPRDEIRIRDAEREEHRAREAESLERFHKAIDRSSREQLIKALLAVGPREEILRHLATESLEEHIAKEKALKERRLKEEQTARDRESVERLQKAIERASREQLIKAFLAPNPREQILRSLEAESLEEHRAREKALEEQRAKERGPRIER